jgi:hypothetical protein
MPGQQIIKWNYIYGNNEAHCGPHYYIGEFYGWKRGLYRLYRSVKTSKQCADDAEVLADLGVPLPRPNK